jgi:hypothetical protein
VALCRSRRQGRRSQRALLPRTTHTFGLRERSYRQSLDARYLCPEKRARTGLLPGSTWLTFAGAVWIALCAFKSHPPLAPRAGLGPVLAPCGRPPSALGLSSELSRPMGGQRSPPDLSSPGPERIEGHDAIGQIRGGGRPATPVSVERALAACVLPSSRPGSGSGQASEDSSPVMLSRRSDEASNSSLPPGEARGSPGGRAPQEKPLKSRGGATRLQ